MDGSLPGVCPLDVWKQSFHALYDSLPFMQRVKAEQDRCEPLRNLRDYLEDTRGGESYPHTLKRSVKHIVINGWWIQACYVEWYECPP